MKLVTRNAASLLFDKANLIDGQPYGWRCLHLNLSQRNYRHELIFHFFVKPIVELLVEDEGNIFLCEDGDIIILFKGAAKPILAKLATHFADLKTGVEESDVFRLFDLSVYRQPFYELCSAKLHVAEGAVA
jgi:hypothetical protein